MEAKTRQVNNQHSYTQFEDEKKIDEGWFINVSHYSVIFSYLKSANEFSKNISESATVPPIVREYLLSSD